MNVARIEGRLQPNVVRQALDLIQKHHPLLQVTIRQTESSSSFCLKEELKIPLQTIPQQHGDRYLELAEHELHQKFVLGMELLCRVTLLCDAGNGHISEIIATFHHAIADGIACMSFFDELLTYCQQITEEKAIDATACINLLSPVEDLLDINLLKDIECRESKPTNFQLKNQQPKLIIESDTLSEKHQTHLITRSLSPENTLKLKKLCRQEKTTVHGALSAAMLWGAAQILAVDSPVNLSFGSSINLRKYCQPKIDRNYLGCVASFIEEIYTLNKNIVFWDLARETKSKLDLRLKSADFLISNESLEQNYSSEQLDYDVDDKFLAQQMQRNYTLFLLSNLGQFTFSDRYGQIKLKEIYFWTGQHTFGSCIGLGAITFAQQLFCSFSYVYPLISKQTANKFANLVIKILNSAVIN